MKFEELNLAPALLKAVLEQGYETPTPIQAQAIPAVLAGHDLLAGAQTGTGKTAAFTLPMLHRLSQSAAPKNKFGGKGIRALVLTPTRELAAQVEESVREYGKYLDINSTVVFGGVGMNPQIDRIKRGVDILVATPGRLLDLQQQGFLDLSTVQVLVLDEADRMLDMGFVPDVTRIINLLPKQRQSLLFSATFSEEIKKLADKMLKSPILIEVAKRNTVVETITHRVHPVAADAKRALLVKLLRSSEFNQVLVFTRTKIETNKLARDLQRAGIAADSIHGDKSQLDRLKALEAFKNGTVLVLVATDVAARGLDIDDLPHVINFELPHTPEDYIHRIGRTGRAGKQGTAISLVSAHEVQYLVDIEKLIKIKVEQVIVPGFDPEYDYEYPPTGRKSHHRRPPAPSTAVAPAARPRREHSPAVSSSSRRKSHIAADGFDFSKPYESASPHPLAAPADAETAQVVAHMEHPHKPRRLVAALLGGLGRKKG